MNPDTIKEYWNEQARKLGADPRATTQDYWMRELEIASLSKVLARFPEPLDILDIGCGNGFSTLRLLQAHPRHRFVGGDYSVEMVRAAMAAVEELPSSLRANIRFEELDVLDLSRYRGGFDLIISDRCLINLPSRELQWQAIAEIERALRPGGCYLAIENFVGGQAGLNEQRTRLGLPEISVRWHNCFFEEAEFLAHCAARFDIQEFVPLSSTYYLLTRVVYSKLCQIEGREPDYDHPIYEIAVQLPPVGDFGPIKLAHLRKKEVL